MTSRRSWVAPAAAALGVGAVAVAAIAGDLWALLGAGGGALLLLALRGRRRSWRRGKQPPLPPLDFWHTLDLLRRAHHAAAAWATGLQGGVVRVTAGGAAPDGEALQRGVSLVCLAAVDGRTHVERDGLGTYVAVGDHPYGAGLLLAQRDASPEAAEAACDDLRRVLASMRLAEAVAPRPAGEVVARRLAAVAAGAETLDAVAKAGAEVGQEVSQRGVVIAVRDSAGDGIRIEAVSSAADQRLQHLALAAASPATRAIADGVPVVTHGVEDIFGPGVPERRREERAGSAFPLFDGGRAVGALVVVGPPLAPDGPLAEQLGWLGMELGPRLAAARAVREAEKRATSDPLTGLCNRREFERVIDKFRRDTPSRREPATLIYADLDHFKRLNDTLGHAAGDAALRHVATVLQDQVREGDLVARIGGEEFAVWLPRRPLSEGLEVAERIRRAVEGSPWLWQGSPQRLTTSCGVASYPEPVGDVDNLRSTADAALYGAKQAGRNRVEVAGGRR